MAERKEAKKAVFRRAPRKAKAAPKVTAEEVVAQPKAAAKKIAAKIDPTTKKTGNARKPAVEDLVRRAKGSFAMALLHRFVDAEVMAQSAALAFYALLSLAPLLLILLWLTSNSPQVTESLLRQIADFVGAESGQVARTIVENAARRPDVTSIAGWWSLFWLFVGATAVFAQLQDALNKIFRTDATRQRAPPVHAAVRKIVVHQREADSVDQPGHQDHRDRQHPLEAAEHELHRRGDGERDDQQEADREHQPEGEDPLAQPGRQVR